MVNQFYTFSSTVYQYQLSCQIIEYSQWLDKPYIYDLSCHVDLIMICQNVAITYFVNIFISLTLSLLGFLLRGWVSHEHHATSNRRKLSHNRRCSLLTPCEVIQWWLVDTDRRESKMHNGIMFINLMTCVNAAYAFRTRHVGLTVLQLTCLLVLGHLEDTGVN